MRSMEFRKSAVPVSVFPVNLSLTVTLLMKSVAGRVHGLLLWTSVPRSPTQ